jgi:hypothetical protein
MLHNRFGIRGGGDGQGKAGNGDDPFGKAHRCGWKGMNCPEVRVGHRIPRHRRRRHVFFPAPGYESSVE